MEKILSRFQDKMNRLPDYADLRYVETERVRIRTKDGALDEVKETLSRGAGFRVLHAGAFGFSGTRDLSEKSLSHHLHQARRMASRFSKIRQAEVKFVPAKPVKAQWQTPIGKDPWKLSVEEKTAPLLEAQRHLKSCPWVDSASGVLDFTRKKIIFISSEGSRIEQTLYRTGGWLHAETWQGGEKIRRSWPGPTGLFRGAGYEVIDALKFPREARRLGEELKELRQSPEAPCGPFDLILTGSVLALQIHETFGHGSESDRLFGYEDNFGGRTFLDPSFLRKSRVASSAVNLVSDGTSSFFPSPPWGRGKGEGVGTFAYDDEGMVPRKVEIIRKGIFQGYLTNRETAFFLGLPASSGNAVAEDWSHYPLIRMTNTNLMPGKGTLQEMISGVRDGFLLDNELSWSVDQRRYDFQIGAETGYRIKKGKIRGMVRFPFYHGNTPDFWRSCDRVAGKKEWAFWGFADCGKGGPCQEAFTGHGLSPARFRNVPFGRE